MSVDDALLFHHTGTRAGPALGTAEEGALRPALFARFHDLARLRYDFPIVLCMPSAYETVVGRSREQAPAAALLGLVERVGAGPVVLTLSGIVDELLREVAPRGIGGERIRRNVLRLEREIRTMLVEDAGGTLAALWDRAAERLVTRGGAPGGGRTASRHPKRHAAWDEGAGATRTGAPAPAHCDGWMASDLERARAALRVDGAVLDCDARMPGRLVTHAWRSVRERKARDLRARIDALVAKLSDLVRADHLRSQAGRRAAALRASVGTPHQDLFDFELMAHLLARPSGGSGLPPTRRRRIERTLAVLRARSFASEGAHAFVFDRVDAALAAYRARLPVMALLVRAIATAELEVEGRYVEAKHDEQLRGFDERSLTGEDLALFPDQLVCLDGRASSWRMDGGGRPQRDGRAQLLEALTSGAPLKILLVTDDAFGLDAKLATAVMGLGDVFVVQAASSDLFRAAPDVLAALEHPGPALISVFSGAVEGAQVPPYLVAAAAKESRAFPSFTYDPSARAEDRLSLSGDPQPERIWPVHELTYADEALQRVTERLPFTPADLALCDPRRRRHFAEVPRDRWNGGLVPTGEWAADGSDRSPDTVPCVYAVDDAGRLRKLVVDRRLAEEVRQRGDAWRRLTELERLGRSAPAAAASAPVAAPPEPTVAAAPPTAVAALAAEPAEAGTSLDDAYIETPRCTSCNECTQINGRMFAYDGNKQAYIKDLGAGTYRELVEAAESCQVAIIHPGKPRDPNEPGLDELLERAAAFP